MMVNLLATVLVSVVTNWTAVYVQIDTGMIQCDDSMVPGSTPAIWYNRPYHYQEQDRYKNGRYLGKDGVVVRVTKIKFNYNGKPQVHRIEEPLERIIMRCTEQPPIQQEPIWDEPIREKIEAEPVFGFYTNSFTIADSLFTIADMSPAEYVNPVTDEIEKRLEKIEKRQQTQLELLELLEEVIEAREALKQGEKRKQ